jgi:hypothetical protein
MMPMTPLAVSKSLTSREYMQELYKLDFNDRNELGDELMVNQLGYFMFDAREIYVYVSTPFIANSLYKADKIYLRGSYSYILDSLGILIENNLHLQIQMLDIEINQLDNMQPSWELLSKLSNLKLLYIDGGNHPPRYNKSNSNITSHLPVSLEALSIVNMPYFDEPISPHLSLGNLKILKLMTLKFNQELGNLPHTLETLIIESGNFNQPIDNLPRGLKHLILLCPTFAQHLDTLPHGLEYFAGLYFNCFIYPENTYDLELINLPSSIKTIMLDKFLFKKQNEILKQIYKDSKILYYEDFNNFEFIINNLLTTIQ